jgi:O-acetylhomoserine (thiol)-lyase
VIHPASTTHSQLTRRSSRKLPASTPDWCGLSVGIEHVDDIMADLEAGFRAAKGA